jgi:ribosomal protein L40E
MPPNRPNLTLDEQSFQDLLSAAFTIQEHNEQRRQARLTRAEGNSVCPHCGALKPAEGLRCESCGLDELRPGERLQRNWASMWLMSQEQGLWPERSPEIGEAAQEVREATEEYVPPLPSKRRRQAQAASDLAASNFLGLPLAKKAARDTSAQEGSETIHDGVRGKSPLNDLTFNDLTLDDLTLDDRRLGQPALDKVAAEGQWSPDATEAIAPEDSDVTFQQFHSSIRDDSCPTEASSAAFDAGIEAPTGATLGEMDGATGDATSSMSQRPVAWRVKMRSHRADLYLGAAAFVAVLALLWPAASAPRRAVLAPWERMLVTLGIADAPAPATHVQGDPAIDVWVDPHTALYYCPGEEQYGKTADGRFSSQREAQMDRFEPAGRRACE